MECAGRATHLRRGLTTLLGIGGSIMGWHGRKPADFQQCGQGQG